MIMYVCPVCVRINREGVPAFRKSHGELVPQAVGLLRRDFSRGETLTGMIGNNILHALAASREGKVPLFRQDEFSVNRFRRALV